MNKIETLVKNVIANGKLFSPRVFLTAWDKWCVSYTDVLDRKNNLCSVTVEPENEPIKIEDTIGCMNEYVGNAKSLDDAVDMIDEYIRSNYEVE